MKNKIGVALGSNWHGFMGSPESQINQAMDTLEKLFPESFIRSQVLSSAPVGPQDQPDFKNAVVVFESDRSAYDILSVLKGLEVCFGRLHRRRWGEREMDLDLLFVGDQKIDDKTLKIPHPQMKFRTFVLDPLRECDPTCKYLTT